MTYPNKPHLGLLIESTCRRCDLTRLSPVVDFDDYDLSGEVPNDDGSYCYAVRLECSHCSYVATIPVFYNLYSKGVIC